MEKQLYYIENVGCDDTTRGLIELTDKELTDFCNFVYYLNKNSSYGCQPRISIYKGNWDDLKEVDLNNPNINNYYDDDFIGVESRLWLNGKCYTFKDTTKWWLHTYPKINLEKSKEG